MRAKTAIAGAILAASLAGVGVVSAETFSEGTSPGPAPPAQITLTARDPILVGAGDIAAVPEGRRGADEATADLVEAIVRRSRGRVTVFTAGDDAYEDGTTGDFERYYAPTWGRFKAITKPAPGNHEYNTDGAAGYFRYFRVRPYYAYGRGGWRIYSLNSEIAHGRGSAQERWLRRDLAAHRRTRCVLAYWHRPRYSSGIHHSDSSMQALWQVLADFRADVVVSGHDHDYERFGPMQGIRQFVVGTGGRSLYPLFLPVPGSIVRSADTYGVLALTLHRASYDFQFVPEAGGSFRDRGRFACR